MDRGRQQGGGTDWLDQWALPVKDGSEPAPASHSPPVEPPTSSPSNVLYLERWRRRVTQKAPDPTAGSS